MVKTVDSLCGQCLIGTFSRVITFCWKAATVSLSIALLKIHTVANLAQYGFNCGAVVAQHLNTDSRDADT